MRLQVERKASLFHYRDTGSRCMLSLLVGDGGARFMQVMVDFGIAKQIAPGCKEDDLGPLNDPLMLLLLDRLSHMGEEGMSPLLRKVGEFPTYVFDVTGQDVPLAKHLAAEKSCNYQEPVRGGLSCVVAITLMSDRAEETATTRHKCRTCLVPDERLACSNSAMLASSTEQQQVARPSSFVTPRATSGVEKSNRTGHGAGREDTSAGSARCASSRKTSRSTPSRFMSCLRS